MRQFVCLCLIVLLSHLRYFVVLRLKIVCNEPVIELPMLSLNQFPRQIRFPKTARQLQKYLQQVT